MIGTFLRASTLIAVIALMAWGGWTVAAQHGHGGMPAHGHGGHDHGGGMHQAVERVADELDLDADQRRQLEALFAMVAGNPDSGGGQAVLAHELLDHVHHSALGEGEVLHAGSARVLVDQHVEALRSFGYTFGDALATLVGSLDGSQWQALQEHFSSAHDHQSGGHGR